MSSAHDKRIEAIDKKMKIGKYDPKRFDSKSKALKAKKPYYTRADGSHETKAEYYKRHWSDLSKHENN